MTQSNGLCRSFAMLVGAFLLVEGIWGFFSPVVFGVLTTNALHATIHVILGLTGLWVGLRSGARTYCLWLGVLLVTVGVLWFVPVIGPLITSLLNINAAVTYLNLAVGVVALALAFSTRAQSTRS